MSTCYSSNTNEFGHFIQVSLQHLHLVDMARDIPYLQQQMAYLNINQIFTLSLRSLQSFKLVRLHQKPIRGFPFIHQSQQDINKLLLKTRKQLPWQCQFDD